MDNQAQKKPRQKDSVTPKAGGSPGIDPEVSSQVAAVLLGINPKFWPQIAGDVSLLVQHQQRTGSLPPTFIGDRGTFVRRDAAVNAPGDASSASAWAPPGCSK